MNLSITFFPLLPIHWLIIISVIVLGLSIAFAFSDKRNAILRLLCFCALLSILANPHIKTEDRKPLKNIALVITDNSNSQSLANREEVTQYAKQQLSQKLNSINNLEIRWSNTGHNQEEQGRENSGTLLYSKIKQAVAKVPKKLLSGIFIVTDGQAHDVPEVVDELDLNVPVHLLVTGQKKEFDLRLEVIKAPRFGLIGSKSKAKVRVMQDGSDKFRQVVLNIRRSGKLIEKRNIMVGPPVEVPVDFSHPGANIIEVEVEPVEKELTQVNNKLAIIAQGVRENLRVLLVSGEPHLGERTWRNLLKSDASVDLVHFTILRPPDKQDGTPINQLSLIAFPTRELFSEKLDQFDLIIFDRYRRRGVLPLLYLDNITRYVEQGGAILVAAGKTFSSPFSLYRTPLSQVLPAEPTGRVIEKPYRAKVTKSGKIHPVTRGLRGDSDKQASWGRWFRLIQATTKKGDVLMEGPNQNPLLILNRLGKGRVALLLSDHAWLWARGFDGGGPHTILLRRLSHWLMKEPDLEEEYLTAKGYENKIIIERRSMKKGIKPVKMQMPNGDIKTVILDKTSPGIWQKTIDINKTGLYRFDSENLSAIAQTGNINSLEMSKVTATDKVLRPLIDQTSGGIFWLLNEASLNQKQANINSFPQISSLQNAKRMYGDNWMAIRDRNAYQVTGVRHIPIFSGIIILCGLIGIFAMMWFREGK